MIWVQTFTGKAVDLLDPKPDQIDLVDIAIGLSRIARFCGQTKMPYDVALHSMSVAHGIIEEIKPTTSSDWLKVVYGLLHDAHEAYMGDILGPIKQVIAVETDILTMIEDQLDIAIRKYLELPHERLDKETLDLIRRHDLRALMTERRDLHSTPSRSWGEQLELIKPYSTPTLTAYNLQTQLGQEPLNTIDSAELWVVHLHNSFILADLPCLKVQHALSNLKRTVN